MNEYNLLWLFFYDVTTLKDDENNDYHWIIYYLKWGFKKTVKYATRYLCIFKITDICHYISLLLMKNIPLKRKNRNFLYLMIHFSYNKLELPLLCETKAECLNKHNWIRECVHGKAVNKDFDCVSCGNRSHRNMFDRLPTK